MAQNGMVGNDVAHRGAPGYTHRIAGAPRTALVTALGVGLRYLSLILVAGFFLFPVVWVALSSLKSHTELFTYPLTILPHTPTIENYVTAFDTGNFLRYIGNTLFVALVATLITVTINMMAGYALAKYHFVGRNAIFFGMIATLMIPLQVIMVPIFLIEKSLGLLNSLWGIIIPPAATPTGIFLARQYTLSIPDSLIESARIDGASEWRIFYHIIIPLSRPIMATIAIFSFMWRWNDFLWPFIVLSQQRKYTLQLALANFVGQFDVHWSQLLAMTVVAILPMAVVFLFFQRYFIRGIASGAIKY